MSSASPNPHAPLIREATAADLPRLIELLHQLAELSERPEAEAPPLTPGHEAALRALHDDPRSTCLVVEDGGRVEGTLTLYILPNLSHGGRPAAIVENVVVDAARRGCGFGQLLMQRAEALARARGCYKVALTSNRRRAAAHRFYQHIGYTPSHQGFTKYE